MKIAPASIINVTGQVLVQPAIADDANDVTRQRIGRGQREVAVRGCQRPHSRQGTLVDIDRARLARRRLALGRRCAEPEVVNAPRQAVEITVQGGSAQGAVVGVGDAARRTGTESQPQVIRALARAADPRVLDLRIVVVVAAGRDAQVVHAGVQIQGDVRVLAEIIVVHRNLFDARERLLIERQR
ncbi:MAG: hypothetical protein MUF48_23980, partial [Pirellulaceae bacterium]|nr:hypothetical protein [Pirellulaceae bacterium]